MRRRFGVFWLLLLVCAIAIAMPAFAQPAAKSSPDYYPLPINAWWKYQNRDPDGTTSELTVKVLKTLQRTDGSTWIQTQTEATESQFFTWYSKPKGLVLLHQVDYPQQNDRAVVYQLVYNPVRTFLKNPLTKGDTWRWKGKEVMEVELAESSTVLEPEDVVVPAGKFTATKVVTQVTLGGVTVKRSQWFANQVGMVKGMMEAQGFRSTVELLDYRLPK